MSPRCGSRGGHPRRPARIVGRPRRVSPRRAGGRPDHVTAEPRAAARARPEPMSTALLERPVEPRAANGGAPARRAMVRWAWRLFRREWRPQLLVLALLVVAVLAAIVGAG